MTTLLFAIADCDRASAPERTSTGRRLRAVGDAGPVAILAADVEADGRGDPAALREHEGTVAELMEHHTVLPVRYGTRLTESEAEVLVRERREELMTALERVREAVEVSIAARVDASDRADGADGSVAEAGSGTAYLRGRLARAQAAARVEELLEPLRRHAREHRRLGAGAATDASALRQAYLVDRDGLDAFLAAVRALDAGHPELELLCTGPWPPYSFCGGGS